MNNLVLQLFNNCLLKSSISIKVKVKLIISIYDLTNFNCKVIGTTRQLGLTSSKRADEMYMHVQNSRYIHMTQWGELKIRITF